MASKQFFAIVAGVGPGTGRSVAVKFAKTYPVVLLARKPENYNDIVTEINKSGGYAVGISTDVADSNAVNTTFERIKKELPNSRLAAAIFNAAGGFGFTPFLESTVEQLNQGLEVNG